MQKEIPKNMDSLPVIVDLVARFFRVNSLDRAFENPVNLVLEELFSNMVRHGEPSEDPVDVSLELAGTKLLAVLTEKSGLPFDLTKFPAAITNGNLQKRKIGGLGIHLVRSFVDTLEYRREKNRNIIRLTLSLEKQHVSD